MEKNNKMSKIESKELEIKENRFDITSRVIKKFINDKINENFTYNQLQDEVVSNGGIMRITYRYPVSEYLEVLEEDGFLEYEKKSDTYKVIKRIPRFLF